jgi:hypothetical protein
VIPRTREFAHAPLLPADASSALGRKRDWLRLEVARGFSSSTWRDQEPPQSRSWRDQDAQADTDSEGTWTLVMSLWKMLDEQVC